VRGVVVERSACGGGPPGSAGILPAAPVQARCRRSQGGLRVRGAVAGVLVIFTLLLPSCRNDMRNEAKLRPLQESDFFNDQRSARLIPPGTVAHGVTPSTPEEIYLATGKINGKLGDTMPFPLTPEVLARGQERFNIYCSPCHDRAGTGQGMIVQRGFARPPSYHIDRLRQAPLGHFVDVIAHGFGAMYSYAYRVRPRDRWAIAAYIRVLQLSQGTSLSDVPEQERQELEQKEK
jgi:hypothetical protein